MTAQPLQPPPEFVAVVLAATTGARLFPLTTGGTAPKHLLPVGGKPILARLLTALRDFTQVYIALAAEDRVTIPALFCASDDWQPVDAAAAAGDMATTTTTDMATEPHPPTTADELEQPQVSVWKRRDDASTTTTSTLSTHAHHLPAQVTLVRLPEDCAGSAQVLRELQAHLPPTSHVLVVPGDLVVSESRALADLLHAHRQGHQPSGDMAAAACTVLLQDVGEQDEQGYPLKESAKQKKGGLAREPEEIAYMGLSYTRSAPTAKGKSNSSSTPRLIWKLGKLQAEQDQDFTGQTPKLQLPKARLRASGGIVKIRKDWNDLHAYVLSPWVVRLVQAKTRIVSLQTDLLPLLIRRQFLGKVETFGSQVESHRIIEALGGSLTNSGGDDEETDASSTLQQHHAAPLSPHQEASLTTTVLRPNQTYAVLAHVSTGAMRSHSLPAYLYASKDLLHKLVQATAVTQAEPCLSLPPQSSTNPKFVSLTLADAQIGDKPTFKSSIVGRRCKLGHKCRLNNVLLMDDVQVGNNAVLQNTIVGPGAVIGDNCSLNDCQVAAGKQVPSGTKEKGEVLVDTLTVG
jgi:translation initiation factor eIF-2B subunit gamma